MLFKIKRLVYLVASCKKENKQQNFILYYLVKKYALLAKYALFGRVQFAYFSGSCTMSTRQDVFVD